MHINTIENNQIKFKTINIALIFLSLGLLTSPTVLGAYHIFIFIPTLLLLIKGLRVKLNKSSYFLLALVTWGLISTFVNIDTLIKPHKAFQDVKYYAFGVFCIVTLKYYFDRANPSQVSKLFKILLFTVIVGFFVGISKSWFGFDIVKWESGDFHPRSGGFTNYMRYGYASSFLLLFGIAAAFNFDKIKKYITLRNLVLFILFNLFAIFVAKTRGAVLGLAISLPFLLLKYRPRIAKSMFALGVLSIILIGSYSLSKKSTNRYFNINDGSNRVRMSQFYSAIKSIEEKPIFGLGADQFSYNVPRLKQKYDIWAKDYSGHSHNIFLEHAANFGIPGLILFLGFLIAWFVEMIKTKTNLGWVVASYIVAFVVAGQVELLFDVINSHLIFFVYSFSQYFLFNQSKTS